MTDVAGHVIKINDRWPIWLPEHRAAREEWFIGWERERLAAMYDTIKPGDVVYDVGAEEGDFAGLFAMWTRGACRHCRLPFGASVDGGANVLPCKGHYEEGGVVLFEPNPRVWPNIKAIFDANGLRPLGCFVGFAGDVGREPWSSPMNGYWPDCADGPVIGDHGFCNLNERPDLPAVRLDDWPVPGAPEYLPDVITIDTEGSELRVLKGAEQTLREKRPTVFVSVHPEFMRDMYGDEPWMLHSFMEQLGYEAKHLATDHEEHWQYDPR